MGQFLTSLYDRWTKYRAYRSTVHALRTLPADIALDLDIFPGDAERIARETIYGKDTPATATPAQSPAAVSVVDLFTLPNGQKAGL